jgi:hypothetical protein
MIGGFLFSSSSVYLNHAVFADDSWSDIVARQHASEQNALAKYTSHYKFANLDQSKRNWSGLTSTATNETSKGRNIEAQAQVSLDNAISQFDAIHAKQLTNLTANGYFGLSSIPTDTQGRDRNTMIQSAKASSDVQAEDLLNQLSIIQQSYNGFQAGLTTDTTSTYDRQTSIMKNLNDQEAKAADLVSQLAKIDGVYINLDKYLNTDTPYTYKPGSITSEIISSGRDITTQQAYALEKGVMIFNYIHAQHLAALNSNYQGLTNTPTDTQGRDRNTIIAQEKVVATNNALSVLDAYGSTSLK